ncbi:MAG TPA: RNB domain-containing ribonuclease [Opitutaceae bacterium]|jgi:exoribonuclease-2|nr:RNB domain-containing ribonuclease [Opitutaceae bacterium]
MSNPDDRKARTVLQKIAHRVMIERGLSPDFSPPALVELGAIHAAAAKPGAARDMRDLLWCSIDNDDSKDLDQLSVATPAVAGSVTLFVAIADVSALVRQGSALDQHAKENTTSVYTAGGIFPMLPEKLSTDLTSLGFAVDRVALVVEMTFDKEGAMSGSDVYQAMVRNKAKLAYNSVAAWLDRKGAMPAQIGAVPGLDENIRIQHDVAEKLRARRHMRGALSLQTVQARPVFDGELLRDLVPDQSNVAKSLIEELMVAANGVTARYLASRKFPSIRRVVRTPAKWNQIVEFAAGRGGKLPKEPDGVALEQFLLSELRKSPDHFPDLSLFIIKLLGRGEYVVELPGGTVAGHFGLAVTDYAHSTAPNRRFPDLLIQRLVKAAASEAKPPYTDDELAALAAHCTEQEDAAKKVERQVVKSAGAMLLSHRIGETFDASVTGNSDKGTWVRLYNPPVEGKLVSGLENKKVGDRIRVQLAATDVQRGYIDFVCPA